MSVQYCMKCMNKQYPGVSVCPHCGTPYRQTVQEVNALKPGHILSGKYLVGGVLGQGGFGITYIGLDLLLEKKVAIKEYFPVCTGMVSRYKASAVVWNSDVNQKNGLNVSMDSFLKEARKMAKVDSIPCVVSVRDMFSQNNTAYIVMDYIEGETLLKKLKREGPMSFAQCVTMLTPIMETLAQVHQYGIIHRDISPDNIMIQPNGNLRLLDLGAAKEIDIQKTDGSIQSSRFVAKEGFSPLEQYTSTGRIGTWTDVYSMSATIYYCCTGKLPPLATDRVGTDSLACLSSLQKKEFEVLKQGMSLYSKDRIQTMDELLRQLQALIKSPHAVGNTTVDKSAGHSPENHTNAFPAPFLASVLFGIEALVFLYAACTLETMRYVFLLRITGYLFAIFSLLQTKHSGILYSAGCVSLCLAHCLTGTLAGWAGGITMLSVPVLLLSEQIGIPEGQNWVKKYWFIPVAIYCVYLIMFCVESFSYPGLLLEGFAGCALALSMWEFASKTIPNRTPDEIQC